MMELRKEEGFTLVELLASISLLGVVALLISSVFIFGYRQFENQTTRSNRNNEIREVMNLVVVDLREGSRVEYADGTLIIYETIEGEDAEAVLATYSHSDTTISRDGEIITEYLESFLVNTSNPERVKVELRSVPVPRNSQSRKELETTVYFR